ncbi:hypothetical protein HHK36_004005 [Tetracentron sinense]|uniref:Uncharacterized protein n=1 Tax=Tetracentron sinense TaxID=13715 RepID=A0A835DSQ7_TETSI|nr:hypothetical protein HHK36_004005 [Tetracentron sinense]
MLLRYPSTGAEGVSIGTFVPRGKMESNYSQCSHWFLVEDGTYSFTELDISNLNLTADISTILEWTIGEGNCKDANKKNTSICGENSVCYDSKRHSGYLCECFLWHEGNPYLNGPQGCQAIDYCDANDCVPEATCHNIHGGRHRCTCPKWSEGTMLSIPFMITALFWFYCAQKNRNLAKMRAKYFRRNGGLLLQQHFSSGKGTTTKHIKIFSARELETATNNYDISRVLGCGSQGTVYKGILEGASTIAIKRSQLVAQFQVDQFINELVILSQINHRNIVKLIGCCLETQVPLLVYEFISGGNLYQKLHGDSDSSTQLLWNDRLQIAIAIGEALSYLHSYACMPIFHRDIKSSNILLDENNTAKLADFGVSRLVPLDNKKVSTAVHGTIGYLDPEYFNTGKLTEKSDVYSFGVVLLELLTGRRPIQHEETRDYSSLVMHFQSYVGKENLFEILDEEMVKEGKFEEMRVMAGIASRCLTVFGYERPTMKKVVQKLATMRRDTP